MRQCVHKYGPFLEPSDSRHKTCNKRCLLSLPSFTLQPAELASAPRLLLPPNAVTVEGCGAPCSGSPAPAEPGRSLLRPTWFFTSGCGTVAGSGNDLDVAGETLGAVQWNRLEFQLITFKLCDHRQVTSPCSASSFLFSERGTLRYLKPCRWKPSPGAWLSTPSIPSLPSLPLHPLTP